MARYLVGPYNNSWNFMDAVEKAQNGDTIEFEDGYAFQWPTDRVIVIKKSLHFVGHVVQIQIAMGAYLIIRLKRHLRLKEGLKFPSKIYGLK